MIVYSGTKKSFSKDIMNGTVAKKLHVLFSTLGIGRESWAEFKSWQESLRQMGVIVGDRRIDDDVQIALEYQIPLTSKRVDFMVGGSNGESDNVVVVELKQWEKCVATDLENVVIAYTGGKDREVTHPSQQAYTYAKLIENFNEAVRNNNISLIPCAYLHNYKEEQRENICHPNYKEAIADAPVFLQEDGLSLANFIADRVNKPSKKDLFDIIENGKLKPSKSLQDVVGSILNDNKEFEMIDEQQVSYAKILKLVQNTINDNSKHVIIVQGGPGTGKSVIAINLLAKITNNGFSCEYVTKTSAPRATFIKHLIRGKRKISYLKGLFLSACNIFKNESNKFSCILVDEAHRLCPKSGRTKGKDQIKEIINASQVSVFFIDEDQIVTTRDYGTIKRIIETAEKEFHAVVHCGENLKLTSQFRCNGSEDYIAFLDSIIQNRKTNKKLCLNPNYVKVFDNPCEMREELRRRNSNNKARMIAGYCYPWNSKKDKSKMDIILPNGFEAQWNFDRDKFATDLNSFEQVGCIHSTQGLEFEYVGIIIGKDLLCRKGIVVTNREAVSDSDNTSGIKKKADEATADRLIRNTYKVLLTRGTKGCFIYCEDDELRSYIKKQIEIANKNQELIENIKS